MPPPVTLLKSSLGIDRKCCKMYDYECSNLSPEVLLTGTAQYSSVAKPEHRLSFASEIRKRDMTCVSGFRNSGFKKEEEVNWRLGHRNLHSLSVCLSVFLSVGVNRTGEQEHSLFIWFIFVVPRMKLEKSIPQGNHTFLRSHSHPHHLPPNEI